MTAKICADIKPNGMNQGDLVDVLYDIVSSIQGICTKLDSDGGVPLTTYVANCVTAIFNCVIDDTKGNHLNLAQAETSTLEPTAMISPTGIGNPELLSLMYQITNSWETLTEQLDTDALTDSTYEALSYTVYFKHSVENIRGNTLGGSTGMADGTHFTFRPGGVMDQRALVDWLYNVIEAIYTTCAQLDADGTVTDTNYEALWYTGNILITVENGAGNRNGN